MNKLDIHQHDSISSATTAASPKPATSKSEVNTVDFSVALQAILAVPMQPTGHLGQGLPTKVAADKGASGTIHSVSGQGAIKSDPVTQTIAQGLSRVRSAAANRFVPAEVSTDKATVRTGSGGELPSKNASQKASKNAPNMVAENAPNMAAEIAPNMASIADQGRTVDMAPVPGQTGRPIQSGPLPAVAEGRTALLPRQKLGHEDVSDSHEFQVQLQASLKHPASGATRPMASPTGTVASNLSSWMRAEKPDRPADKADGIPTMAFPVPHSIPAGIHGASPTPQESPHAPTTAWWHASSGGVQGLANLVVNQMAGGQSELKVHVHPQGMGDILVSVAHTDDGRMQVHVEANVMATSQWLTQQTSGLLDAIRQSGAEVAGLSIGFGRATLNQTGTNDGGQRRERHDPPIRSIQSRAGGSNPLAWAAAVHSVEWGGQAINIRI